MALEDIVKTLITKHEGKRYFVYDDATEKLIIKGYTVKGYPTIGIGRNLQGKGLSEDEVQYLFANDVRDSETDLREHLDFYDTLTDNRKAALIDICEAGIGTLLKFTTFLALMKAEKYEDAADDLLQTLWASEVGPIRSGDDAALIRGG